MKTGDADKTDVCVGVPGTRLVPIYRVQAYFGYAHDSDSIGIAGWLWPDFRVAFLSTAFKVF